MNNDYRSERERIRTAFRNLRKLGITARMNFACCSSCGHYDLGQKTNRYVFWNRQAEERSWRHNGEQQDWLVSNLYLQFSDLDTAHCVVRALTAEGLTLDWPGTEHKAIGILPTAAKA